MIDRAMHRLERHFMRPLSLAALVAGVAYMVERSWGLGLVLLVVWLAISMIGQSLHRTHTFVRLVDAVPPELTADADLPTLRLAQLERPVVQTASCIVIALIAVLRHYGFRFYAWIPLALVAYVLLTFIGGMVARGRGRAE